MRMKEFLIATAIIGGIALLVVAVLALVDKTLGTCLFPRVPGWPHRPKRKALTHDNAVRNGTMSIDEVRKMEFDVEAAVKLKAENAELRNQARAVELQAAMDEFIESHGPVALCNPHVPCVKCGDQPASAWHEGVPYAGAFDQLVMRGGNHGSLWWDVLDDGYRPAIIELPAVMDVRYAPGRGEDLFDSLKRLNVHLRNIPDHPGFLLQTCACGFVRLAETVSGLQGRGKQ